MNGSRRPYAPETSSCALSLRHCRVKVEITCAPADFSNVLSALEDKGYTFETAEVQQVPNTYVSLTDEDSMKKMALLLEKLEDNDDVQNVWHNWENEADYEG